MAFTISEVAEVLEKICSKKIVFTIIGSTVIDLVVGAKEFKDDLDLFASEPSPFIHEDVYKSLAEEYNWQYGYTELGTPRFVAKSRSGDIVVEFYDNILDFYIPPAIIENSTTIRLGSVKARILKPEDYVVLKARAGRSKDIDDLKRISKLVPKKLRLDQRRIKKNIELFDPEDQRVIKRILSDIGLI